MKLFAASLVVAVVTAAVIAGLCWMGILWPQSDSERAENQPKSIEVFLLSGEVVTVQENNYGKITPFVWAMTLDMTKDPSKLSAVRAAFEGECEKQSDLREKVNHHIDTHYFVDASIKASRNKIARRSR